MVVIKINGEAYPIKYGINSISEFEAITGKQFDASIGEDIGIGTVRALFHVGLKGGNANYANNILHSGTLLEQAIEEHGIEEVGNIISKAAGQSLGKPKAPIPQNPSKKQKKRKKH